MRDTPSEKSRLATIMQYGVSCAGMVKKKKDAFMPRWSWVTVYAIAMMRPDKYRCDGPVTRQSKIWTPKSVLAIHERSGQNGDG
jgi:hypothetical protein